MEDDLFADMVAAGQIKAPKLEWIKVEPQKLLLDPSPYQRLTGSLGLVPEDRYADSAVQAQLLENYENSV